MDYTHGIMDRLEKWRYAQRKTKAEMARLMGCTYRQQYSNWLERDSLPKKFWPVAAKLLGDDKPKADPYEGSAFQALSDDEKREVVLALIPSLSGESKAAALKLLLVGK